MAIRTINYTVSVGGITPASQQFGGTQGDHNAVELKFTLDTELYNNITANAEGTVYYRFDGYDGSGGVKSTEPAPLDNKVCQYSLEEWLTRYGGKVQVYLVLTDITDTTEMELYSFPAVLNLKDRPDGHSVDGGDYESISTLYEGAKASADRAEDAAERAEQVLDDLGGAIPNIDVTEVSDGVEITVSSKDGIETAKVYNGQDGKDGKDGKDGADGVVDYSLVANALKGSASGSVVGIKDVSPLPHNVNINVLGVGGETLTKTATLNTMGANVTLNNPADSVRIELYGGAYCVGGVVPVMSSEDIVDMLGTAIVPTYSYGETPGIMNLSYTVSGNVLSWTGTLTTNIYDNPEVYEVSGNYTLGSADQKITGFTQVFGLNNDNPYYQTPEYDNLDVTVSIFEGGMPTVKVYGKNLFNNDTSLIAKHSFISSSTGTSVEYWGYVLPLVKGKYTIHAEGDAYSFIYGALMDADGIRQGKVNIVAEKTLRTVTFDALDGYSLFMYFGVNNTLSVAKSNFELFDIQLEVGSTATAYESYKEPVTYTTDENGNVDIPSQYPSMTIIPDSDGAELSVEYNRDINKAFQELQNVVAQLQTLAVATVPMTEEVNYG